MGLYMKTPFSQSVFEPTNKTDTLHNSEIYGALLALCRLLARQTALDFVQDADILFEEDTE